MSDTQATIDGDAPDGEAVIQTHARVARPLCAPLSAIADEIVLAAADDGLFTEFRDPANVAHGHVRIHPAAFDQYGVTDGGVTLGVNTARLTRLLRDAHMTVGDPDPVALTLGMPSIEIAIEKTYGATTVQRADELYALDPDSVRQPDESLDEMVASNWAATIDTAALAETVDHIGHRDDHVTIAERDGDLVVRTLGEDGPACTATIPDVATAIDEDADDGAWAKLSIDYLRDIATAIDDAKCDAVTIEWKEQYPVVFRGERTIDDELAYEVAFAQAPRVGGDD